MIAAISVVASGLWLAGATASAGTGPQGAKVDALLAALESTRTECPAELSSSLRASVFLDCGAVEPNFKRFKRAWERATHLSDGLSGMEALTSRWVRWDKAWRRRYYWVGQTPLLVLFNVENGQIALARYEIRRLCSDRARQKKVSFVPAEERGVDASTPVLVHHVVPEFPERGRLARLSAVVLLWFVVDEQGAVSNLCLIDAMPHGHGFAEAAMEAVARWRYEPVSIGGDPIATEMLTHVSFEQGTAVLPYADLLEKFFVKP